MRLSRQRSILQRTRGNPKDRADGLDGAALEAVFAELEREVTAAFARYGITEAEGRYFLRSVSMRYARQVHEVPVPVGSLAAPDAVRGLLESFDRIYEQRYGRGTGSRTAVVEITNCHLQLVQTLPKAALHVASPAGPLVPFGHRRVYLGEWAEVPVYRWEAIPLRASFAGPALIDAAGTTVWIDAKHEARVDSLGNLHLTTC